MRRSREIGAFLARPSTCFAASDCLVISVDRLEAVWRPGLRSEKKYQRHGGDAAMAMWALRVVDGSVALSVDLIKAIELM